jgi:hypothetical protein
LLTTAMSMSIRRRPRSRTTLSEAPTRAIVGRSLLCRQPPGTWA